MITCDFDILTSAKCDVCVVGSGPVGRALALDLNCRGLSVLVLESGLVNSDQRIQSLSDAFIKSPRAHHRMDHAISRSLGGTSRLWGGRCVFLDEIDFVNREISVGTQEFSCALQIRRYIDQIDRPAAILNVFPLLEINFIQKNAASTPQPRRPAQRAANGMVHSMMGLRRFDKSVRQRLDPLV